MGNKINPLIYRANISNNWKSKWYTDNFFSSNVILDFLIRNKISDFMSTKSPYDLYIERLEESIIIILVTSKRVSNPLVLSSVIEELESKKCIVNNVISNDLNNSVESVVLKITDIIRDRKNYRSYINKFFYNSNYKNITGIKIIISGRINGVEIARRDVFCVGNVSLVSLSQFYSYRSVSFNTKYGIIGIKIYISIKQC
ncbi:hypothetical protein [Candidatus Vidania fulgoroideorum]